MQSIQPVPANRRRDKPQLSCNFCRSKKLRCDRQTPCANCTSRGRAPSCTYARSGQGLSSSGNAATPATLQSRISQLEGLVMRLMQNANTSNDTKPQLCAKCLEPLASSINSPSTSVDSDPSAAGKLQQGSEQSAYVSGSHWKAVLDGISELKGLCETDEPTQDPVDLWQEESEFMTEDESLYIKLPRERPRLLYGSFESASKADILAAMPDRGEVDQLVSAYFNNSQLPHTVIHPMSFMRQYEEFWKSPFDTSLMWISLLYGMMCVSERERSARAAMAGGGSGGGTRPLALRPRFLDQVEQSLALGDYGNGGSHAIEALIHYFMIEHTRYQDPDVGTWLLAGIHLRLGLRMGYHRDPSHFPSITPFEGEMRRRIWSIMYALDIMLSLQLGLPRMIKDGQWDTKPPRNLLDSDFDGDTLELPPPRPETEITSTMYLNAKHRILRVVGTIADTTMNVERGHNSPLTRATEAKLMERLQDTYNAFPELIKFESFDTTNFSGSQPWDILNRLSVTVLYQKGVIVLNWHHVMSKNQLLPLSAMQNDSNTSNATKETMASYKRCIEAALKVLELQRVVEAESCPNGTFFQMRFILLAIVKHEFVMATMVLITHMYRVAIASSKGLLDEQDRTEADVVQAALRQSYDAWLRHSVESKEAGKVVSLLRMLFRKLSDADGQARLQQDTTYGLGMIQTDYPDLALLGEFGLLHHLQDLNDFLKRSHSFG